MIPRLWTRVELVTIEPSMFSEKVWVERVKEFVLMMRSSDLLQLSLRKLCCIHDCLPARQVVRVERVAEVLILAEG